CKVAMPDGLLGLMLGGMIFATASSLNATLNISAGVFTNDIFKRLSPGASDKTLMRVARFSTLGFGVLALVVALLVKSMGGIVNVVISVAALTGVPVYLPVIWSLFSRRQNARTILSVTLASLAVNLVLKFVAPLFGLSLSRGAEMGVGAFVPVLLLVISEIWLAARGYEDPRYAHYKSLARKEGEPTVTAAEGKAANRFTRRVLGLGIMAAGLLIGVLGAIADTSRLIPMSMGVIVLAGGAVIRYRK
ncbi:MAG: sodium transporter, partial [Muribaculaceae bacterium]|nr:sodium transporter [Muribaculaceae bacterium]